MTRIHSAPRRRERDQEAALGDAPILLSLPSLCGVPDPKDEHAAADSSEPLDPLAPHSDPSAFDEDAASSADMGAESTDQAAQTTQVNDDSFSQRPNTKLAKPAYSSESMPPETTAEPDHGHDHEAAAADETFTADTSDASDPPPASDEDEWAPPTPKSNTHRNIIVSTALFVIMAAGYMYVNNDDSSGDQLTAPAIDVEMGWELEGDSFAGEAMDPDLGPTYSNEFQAPQIDGPALTQESSPLNVAPLPSLNEAASSDFEIQRVGVDGHYPTTSTPDAPYVAENPGTRASGPSSMPMGNSPMTPQEAPNDQPY